MDTLFLILMVLIGEGLSALFFFFFFGEFSQRSADSFLWYEIC